MRLLCCITIILLIPAPYDARKCPRSSNTYVCLGQAFISNPCRCAHIPRHGQTPKQSLHTSNYVVCKWFGGRRYLHHSGQRTIQTIQGWRVEITPFSIMLAKDECALQPLLLSIYRLLCSIINVNLNHKLPRRSLRLIQRLSYIMSPCDQPTLNQQFHPHLMRLLYHSLLLSKHGCRQGHKLHR